MRHALAIVVALSGLVTGSFAFAQTHDATPLEAGRVTAVEPHATRQGKILRQNDAVKLGDILKTDKTGRLRIRLADGSLLTLGGDSQMKVTEHDASSRQTSLELVTGRLRSSLAALSQPGARYEVRTATAVAGVIGTDFEVEVNPEGTVVTCFEGKVMVTSLFGLGSVSIGPGESVKATASELGKPSVSESTGSTSSAGSGESGSMVYTAGNASINGTAITQSAALLDGDILDNGATTLSLVRKGSSIAVGANSRLAVTENNLRLGCGDAMVKTASGMSTLLPGYGITPRGLTARYEVIQTQNQLQVLAHEGDIDVFVGSREVTVPSGQMITLQGECIDDAALRNSIPGPNAAGGPSGIPGAIASGKIPLTTLIVTGVGLGAAGLSCYEWCGIGNSKPISPSGP